MSSARSTIMMSFVAVFVLCAFAGDALAELDAPFDDLAGYDRWMVVPHFRLSDPADNTYAAILSLANSTAAFTSGVPTTPAEVKILVCDKDLNLETSITVYLLRPQGETPQKSHARLVFSSSGIEVEYGDVEDDEGEPIEDLEYSLTDDYYCLIIGIKSARPECVAGDMTQLYYYNSALSAMHHIPMVENKRIADSHNWFMPAFAVPDESGLEGELGIHVNYAGQDWATPISQFNYKLFYSYDDNGTIKYSSFGPYSQSLSGEVTVLSVKQDGDIDVPNNAIWTAILVSPIMPNGYDGEPYSMIVTAAQKFIDETAGIACCMMPAKRVDTYDSSQGLDGPYYNIEGDKDTHLRLSYCDNTGSHEDKTIKVLLKIYDDEGGDPVFYDDDYYLEPDESLDLSFDAIQDANPLTVPNEGCFTLEFEAKDDEDEATDGDISKVFACAAITDLANGLLDPIPVEPRKVAGTLGTYFASPLTDITVTLVFYNRGSSEATITFTWVEDGEGVSDTTIAVVPAGGFVACDVSSPAYAITGFHVIDVQGVSLDDIVAYYYINVDGGSAITTFSTYFPYHYTGVTRSATQNLAVEGYNVWPHNGEFFEAAADVVVSHPDTPFAFVRTYKSFGANENNAGLGYGWDYNYNIRIEEPSDYSGDDVIYLHDGAGNRFTYTQKYEEEDGGTTTTYFEAPSGRLDEIVRTKTSTTTDYVLNDKFRNHLEFDDGDQDGDFFYLSSIVDRKNNEMSFTRVSGAKRKISVVALPGSEDYDKRLVKFHYDGSNYIDYIEVYIDKDPTDQMIAKYYYYYDSGNLKAVERSDESTFIQGSGVAVIYQYDSNNCMTKIYDEDNTTYSSGWTLIGDPPPFVENIYDSASFDGSVWQIDKQYVGLQDASHEHDTFDFTYYTDPYDTQVQDRSGTIWRYQFNDLGLAVHVLVTEDSEVCTVSVDYNIDQLPIYSKAAEQQDVEEVIIEWDNTAYDPEGDLDDELTYRKLSRGNLEKMTKKVDGVMEFEVEAQYDQKYNMPTDVSWERDETELSTTNSYDSGTGDLDESTEQPIGEIFSDGLESGQKPYKMHTERTYYDGSGEDAVLEGLPYEVKNYRLENTEGSSWETPSTNNMTGKTVYTYYGITGDPDTYRRKPKTIERYYDSESTDCAVTEYLEYDDKGRAIRIKDPRGVTTKNEYNVLGRLEKVTYRFAQDDANMPGYSYDIEYEYDDRGNLTKKTVENRDKDGDNPVDIITEYGYDLEGRTIWQIVDSGGLELRTDYFYDDNDNQEYIATYENGDTSAVHVTKHTYTERNLVETRTVAFCTSYSNDVGGEWVFSGTLPDPITADEYDYDEAGNVISVKDHQDNETRYFYDEQLRRYATVGPLVSIVPHDSDTAVDRHIVTWLDFDEVGNVIERVTYACTAQQVENEEFDYGTKLARSKDEYDETSRRYKHIEYLSDDNYGWGSSTQLVTWYYRIPDDTPDDDGGYSVAKTVDPTGLISTTLSDWLGRTAMSIPLCEDPDTPLAYTEYTYDKGGNTTETMNCDGGTSYYTQSRYDVYSRLVAFANRGTTATPIGNTDGDWASARATHLITEHGYDSRGLRVWGKDPEEIQTEVVYDNAGRRTEATEDDGGSEEAITTFYYYNHTGQTRYIEDAKEKKTYYIYDSLSRITDAYYGAITSGSTPSAWSNHENTAYDDEYRTVTVHTKDDYDATQRTVVRIFDASGHMTKDYLSSGTWSGIKGRESLFDGLGRLRFARTYLNESSGYLQTEVENTYNSIYNLTQVQSVDLNGDYDVADTGEKKTVTCEEYDDAGRLTEFSYSWGRTIQLNRKYEQSGQEYDDPMLRVRRVRDVTKSLHNVAEYDYLGASRLKEREYYNTTELLVGHDSGGYVSGYDVYRRTVEFSNTGATGLPVFEYVYDKNSNRTSEEVSSTTYNIFTYDNLNRITGAKYEANALSSPITWSKYTEFELDLLGNRISVDDDVNGSVAAGVQTTTYGDGYAAGCANDLHQYAAITLPDSSTVNPTHDDAGNQTDNDDDMQYKWDYLDRLAEIQDQSGTPKTIAKYVYDADGRRVLKEDYDGAGSAVELAVRYVYNGWQCIEEYEDPDGDGGGEGWGEIPARDYVYGNNIDEILQYRCTDASEQGNVDDIDGSDVTIDDDQYAADELIGHYLVLWDAEDDPVAYMITDNAAGSGGATVVTVQVPGGENLSAFATSPEYAVMRAYYYHANVQGNVVAITDAAAEVVELITYDIYGRMTAVNADGSDLTPTNGFVTVATYYTGSLTKNPYLFQGRRLDKESGLYYFRNRYYDPQHGRFISRDPAGYTDSYSLYQFVNNNPINYLDPLGLFSNETDTELILLEMKYYARAEYCKSTGNNADAAANMKTLDHLKDLRRLGKARQYHEDYTGAHQDYFEKRMEEHWEYLEESEIVTKALYKDPKVRENILKYRPDFFEEQGIEIRIVESGYQHSGFVGSSSLWLSSFFSFDSAENVDSLDEMMTYIDFKTQYGNKLIKKLTIVGHGNPEGISVGKDNIRYDNTRSTNLYPGNVLKRLKGRFTPDAEVYLAGCDVGSGETGKELLKNLSDMWDVKVTAPSGNYLPGVGDIWFSFSRKKSNMRGIIGEGD